MALPVLIPRRSYKLFALSCRDACGIGGAQDTNDGGPHDVDEVKTSGDGIVLATSIYEELFPAKPITVNVRLFEVCSEDFL